MTTTRTGRRLLSVAAAAAAVLVAAPAAGAAPLTPNCGLPGTEQLCEVWASATTATLGGNPVPIWRFADSGGAARLPLVVTEGDTVRIRLHNTLAVPVSLAMPQLQGVLYGPNGAAATRGADKVGAPAGGDRDYVFVATRPGTFLYEAGPTAAGKQEVAMGLAGAIVVLPATPGTAYGLPATAYDDEAVMVLTEVDPALNGAADPTAFNMRDLSPGYWLVNGSPTAGELVVAAGAKLLVRYVNAGVRNRWAGLLGLNQRRIGTNAEPLANLSSHADQGQTGVVAALPAGGTAETLVTLPSDIVKAGFRYPLFDEGRTLSDVGDGMLAYLEVAGQLSLPSCPAGSAGTIPPVIDDLTATPAKGHIANLGSPTTTTVFTVTGRALECRGVGGVEAPASSVRYAIDTLPGAVSPTAAVDNNGGFTVTLSENDVAAIATGGHHYLIVQGEKNGVWGAVSTVQLIVDNAAPELSVKASPAITNSTGSVTITGSASDRYLGDSDVVSATWSRDGGPVTTVSLTPAVITPVDIVVPVAGLGAGPHTVTLTATDSFGNTSAPVAIQVTVDPTAPAVSDVHVEQSLPADALHPFGGVLTTRNNGTLTFDPNIWAIHVRAAATDGISPIKAMRGSFDDAFCGTVAGAPQISGARLDPKDGSWSGVTEAGFVYVPLTELNRWMPPVNSAIDKAFHVRARDGAGNWSACADGIVTLDRTHPEITVPLQLELTGAGNVAVARSARARNTLVVRLSARDAQGVSAAEFFDGADPGRGKGIGLRPTDGKLDGVTEALASSVSVRRWTPGVHKIQARVRDTAGNWSPVVSGRITVAFPRILGDGFESHRLKHWSRVTGGRRVAVTNRAAVHGRYGLQVATASRPAYVTDATPRRASSYRASFSLTTGTAGTGGTWQTVFAAVDQHGHTALAVQRMTSGAGQVVRIVALRGGRPVESSQTLLSGQRHAISVAWFGAGDGEAGLWVDGVIAARITNLGNAGEVIEAARLGQVGGGNARTRGNLLVDDFESTT